MKQSYWVFSSDREDWTYPAWLATVTVVVETEVVVLTDVDVSVAVVVSILVFVLIAVVVASISLVTVVVDTAVERTVADSVVVTSSESVVWMVTDSRRVLVVGSSVVVIVVVPETVSLALAVGQSALEARVGGEETAQVFVAVSLLVRTLPEGERCLTSE